MVNRLEAAPLEVSEVAESAEQQLVATPDSLRADMRAALLEVLSVSLLAANLEPNAEVWQELREDALIGLTRVPVGLDNRG